jgi:hypothetical protein
MSSPLRRLLTEQTKNSINTMRNKENDRRIRNRLIRSLGIIEDSSPTAAAIRKKHSLSKPPPPRSILSEDIIEEPLKNHCSSRRRNKQQKKSEFKEQSPEDQQQQLHSKIQFNSVVQIKTIPSHVDYSDRVRKHLWSNRHELRESTERNMREFAFERWSVHHVLEEDDMFYDRRSLEFVHPVHVTGYGYY